ncbi:ABC transporter permease subunit [Rhizobium lusitanum]|uniref:Putative spermidine/putrescine transport system permease protein n=1 Tax=Rhizobium lusitanum TaxID=293958 RepID=A0A7X0IPF3_9HYPH|nr:ABC transporter permease subunit [Rhizobium lusitanum]MBB6484728.1 putative spermidine/putrescine transport system permease protein [Rhizobium lusitanum]
MLRSGGDRRLSWAWLGLAPFLAFIVAFEIAPLMMLVKSALTTKDVISLDNFARALNPAIVAAFVNSIGLSLATAAAGTIAGAVVAHLIVNSRSPLVKNSLTALADVTANFGGAPLAFAFVITLGSTGIVTLLLKQIGIDLYPGFRIYSLGGLVVAYLYFQIPLAILLLIPSFQGLRQEWAEAAAILGAKPILYWRMVALPILSPSLVSSFFLLFANAFGAYATAWTLTGSSINLVTIQIAALIRGEVQLEPALADAIAVLSLLIMALCVAAHQLLVRNARKIAS